MSPLDWSQGLDYEGVSAATNIKKTVLMKYQSERRRRERAGLPPRPGEMPPPDFYYGASPVWEHGTILEWMVRRPGKGVGGGRPKGKKP